MSTVDPFARTLILHMHILKHIIKVQRLEIEEKEEKIEDLERDIRLFCFKSLDDAHKRSTAFDRGFNAGLVYNPSRPPFDITDDSSDDEEMDRNLARYDAARDSD